MKYYILYNSTANNGAGYAKATALNSILSGEKLEYVDSIKIKDYDKFFEEHANDDSRIVLCGGDGTLNYFVNHTTEKTRNIEFDYFPTGTGNDFTRDIECAQGQIVKNVNRFMHNLPKVKVKDIEAYFINGIGYGIDGYCCEVGDLQRTKSTKPVNYTTIAIKGILFHFRPRKATIVVDDNPEITVENTWLVPTMKGRCYGGGMYPTPAQDRLAKDGRLSLMTYSTKSAMKALSLFPKIFKGEHVGSPVVKIHTGYKFKVSFDKPCALQIDGDTVLNVTEYEVSVK